MTAEKIFTIITTDWKGDTMIFPVHKNGEWQKNILITRKDLLDFIDKKLSE